MTRHPEYGRDATCEAGRFDNRGHWREPNTMLAIMLCLCYAVCCAASELQIVQAKLHDTDGMLRLQATIHHSLSNEAIQSLLHGIELRFHSALRIRQQRNWWWDKTLLHHPMQRHLTYHPLSKRYIVRTGRGRQLGSFTQLEQALQRLGELETDIAPPTPILAADNRYYATLDSRLDIHSLPAAMQIVAHLSTTWQLRSGTYQWSLQP